MTFPAPPEISSRFGCLDDSAVTVDGAVDAFVAREIVRNSNRAMALGDLAFRYVGNAQGADTDAGAIGGGLSQAWPLWAAALPQPPGGFVIPKKPELTQLRVRVRATITTDRVVRLQIATRRRPFTASLQDAQLLTMTGTGSSQVYEKNDFDVDAGLGEQLSFYAIGECDPDADDALVTGTYGGVASGTVSSASHGIGLFFQDGAAWNASGATVQSGGHYVVFRASSSDARILWGPCPIVDTFVAVSGTTPASGAGLYYWPPLDPAQAGGFIINGQATFEIYKLPDCRLHSIACYTVDREP